MKSIRLLSRIAPLLFLLTLQVAGYSQAPLGFSYQAVIRNNSGTPIAGQSVKLHIMLTNQLGTTTHYEEQHTLTTTPQGLANITIGEGTLKVGTLIGVPWQKGEVYIKVEVDPTGTSGYQSMGNPVKLQSVPYAIFAENANEIVSPDNAPDTDPIFVVKNKLGQVVFAVYQTGVRAYVADTSLVKGAKGGFAIGGLTSKSISESQDYFSITPSSARIWFDDKAKGAKGGFAIGGLTSKGAEPTEYFTINPDSARIRMKDPVKGAKGGFAIGGLTSKGSNSYLQLTPNNYFIGQDAGISMTTGLYNSFIGYQSGFKTSTGFKNYFIGYRSGYNNLGGFSNVFIGDSAGFTNSYGSRNVFIGNQSGTSNTIGRNNTAVGLSSMLYNTKGKNNTALGWYSMALNTEAEENTAVGRQSLYSNMLGSFNTAVGTGALWQMPLSIYNTALGYNAFTTPDIYWNSTALGANAQINASNKVRIGDVNVAVVEATAFFATSDGRFKNLIKAEVKGLDFITRLNPVIYTFDTQKFDEFLMKGVPENTKKEIISKKDYSQSKAIIRSGFVAQDLEKAAKESGYDFNGVHHPTNENDNYSIDYSLLTVPLVKAVQELNTKNEELQKQVDALKAELEAIKAMLKK